MSSSSLIKGGITDVWNSLISMSIYIKNVWYGEHHISCKEYQLSFWWLVNNERLCEKWYIFFLMVKTSKYGHLDISKVEPICQLFDHIYLKLHFHEFFSCIQDTLISIAHISVSTPYLHIEIFWKQNSVVACVQFKGGSSRARKVQTKWHLFKSRGSNFPKLYFEK